MRRVRHVRHLASGETAIANSVFGLRIPYDEVLVSDALGYGDREFTVRTSWPTTALFNVSSSDGEYVIHAGDGYDGMSAFPEERKTLIHELTHVWQLEHTQNVPSYLLQYAATQSTAPESYDYDPTHLDPYWDNYNIEQQAEIVADWFADGQKGFNPDTRQGDERFYYIKAIIKGEPVDYNWIMPPPKALDAGTLDPNDPARVAEYLNGLLLPLLRQRFAATDVSGYSARFRKLQEVFRGLDPWGIKSLRTRLEARRPDDELARLFFAHLSHAGREALVKILRERFPQPGDPEYS
jgi:hypothetical protein